MKVKVIANGSLMDTVLIGDSDGRYRLLPKSVWEEGGSPHTFDTDEQAFISLQEPKNYASLVMTAEQFNAILWRAGFYDAMPKGRSVNRNRVSGIVGELSLSVPALSDKINQ